MAEGKSDVGPLKLWVCAPQVRKAVFSVIINHTEDCERLSRLVVETLREIQGLREHEWSGELELYKAQGISLEEGNLGAVVEAKRSQLSLLRLHKEIGVYFSAQPSKNQLHVVAYRVDSSGIGKKRPLSQTDFRDTTISAARKRPSPPEAAKSSALRQFQTTEQAAAIYNFRPLELIESPIAIWNPVFSKFLRLMAIPTEQFEFDDVQLKRAHMFLDYALTLHSSESDKKVALGRIIFGERALFKSKNINTDASHFLPDGVESITVVLPNSLAIEAFICFQELKTEIGDGGLDPIAQAECDYQAAYSCTQYKTLVNMSCCPAFLVGMAGPNIAVSGAVFTDRFICERLTDYTFVGPYSPSSTCSRTEAGILRVARLMHVLNMCLDDLQEYYRTLMNHTVLPGLAQSSAKSPHFRTFCGKDGNTHELKYLTRLASVYSEKAVWKAQIKNDVGTPSVVVVKFTPRYSPGAHQLLANVGLAPNLWFCERVADVGGLYVVVMDYIESKEVTTIRDYPEAVKSTRRAVKILHEHNFVFGDLREPNILVSTNGSGAKLIDFDWSGVEGKTRYPATISLDAKEIGWHQDVKRRGLIKKEHDEHMFKVMVDEDL